MTIDPAAWELVKWLVVGVFVLIFLLIGLLYNKIERVALASTERLHNFRSHELHPIIANIDHDVERLDERIRELETNNGLKTP